MLFQIAKNLSGIRRALYRIAKYAAYGSAVSLPDLESMRTHIRIFICKENYFLNIFLSNVSMDSVYF